MVETNIITVDGEEDIEYVLGENKFGKYAVPKSTLEWETLSRVVVAGGIHEEETIQFILDNCGTGSIIHAGAFFGDFLPALGGTGNYVLAFEPVKESFHCSVETVSLTFGENHDIHLFCYGLGSETESRKIQIKNAQGATMAGRAKYKADDNTPEEMLQDTQIVCLDDMVALEGRSYDEFSIVHLDVEEHEEEALKGARKIIEASKPILILECWQDATLETPFFQNEIFGIGYKTHGRILENVVLIHE